LVQDLVEDAVALSQHPFGNYVMQHLVAHCSTEQRKEVVRLLAENAASLGPYNHSAAVVGKALLYASQEDQVMLARAVLAVPELTDQVLKGRTGSVVARLLGQAKLVSEEVRARRKTFHPVFDSVHELPVA